MGSWFSKTLRHALSRLVGGESHAEKRQRASLLQQEEEAQREAGTRKDMGSRPHSSGAVRTL
jgi:hypothetical protein